MIREKLNLIVSMMLLAGFLQAQIPVFEEDIDCGITDVTDITNFYGHGVSAVDFDGDGDIDFYMATTSGSKDRLYRNNGQGQFTDVAIQLGVDISNSTSIVIWFDYDGDKKLDFVRVGERCLNFSCGQPILISLFHQEADGTFTDVTANAGLTFGDKYDNLETYAVGGMSAGDLNNDGFLDLVIAIWGGKMTIFLSNGDGTFEDISESSKLGLESKYHWQPMIHDFNGDGWMDVMANVDFAENQLWLNNRNGTFQEVAAQVGANTNHSEMGMTLGDYDNDGDFDLYATNITRIYQGEQEHNVLLKNKSDEGSLLFEEVAQKLGVGESGWDWGTTFADINNDGWVDLATTNGWNNDPTRGPDRSHLWVNINGNFTDHSNNCQFNDKLSATSLIAFDSNRDGDLDLLQTLKDNEGIKTGAILYENSLDQSENKGNYLVIKPRMPGNNHFSIGAVVRARTQSLSMMRLITAGTSFYGQEPAEAWFGTGSADVVDEVKIEWPDGGLSIFKNVEVNQVQTLDYEPVVAPENLSGVNTEDGVILSWNDVSDDETGFILQSSGKKSFHEYDEVILNAGAVEYFDELPKYPTMYYRVRSLRDNHYSPFSGVVKMENVVTAVSSGPEPLDDDISVYPNPVEETLHIRFAKSNSGPTKILLVDNSGRILITSWLTNTANDKIIQLEAPQNPGLYHLIIRSESGTCHKKLIVSGN